MPQFDPDKYLAKVKAQGFNPDSYLQSQGITTVGGSQEQAEASKAYNQAQAQQMAQRGQQKIQQKYAPYTNPFSIIGQAVGLPHAGAVIDAALPQLRMLAEAAKAGASVPSAPDIQTGILRGAQALGEAGLAGASAVHPLGFAQIGGATEAAQQAVPAIRQPLNAIMSPVTSLANPQTPFGKELAKTGDIATQYGTAAIAPAVGSGLETAASKLAGKSFGIGENFMRTEQLGKFAQEHGIDLSKDSYYKAREFASNLNNEIQTKIIQPAKEAGVLIPADSYIQKLQDFKKTLQDRAVPDKASIFAVERMITSAQDRAANSPTPGMIDPETAQKMKVENNAILKEVYDKLAAGGNITERGVAKKAALMEATDELRSQLEQIHPELRNVNWHEGQALQLRDAIYDHLNRTARGEGGTNIVARGGIGKVATVSIYDLLKLRPIGAKVAILLGKAGRGLSGNEPDIVNGVQNPFQAPATPTAPPTPQAGATPTPTQPPPVPSAPSPNIPEGFGSTGEAAAFGQTATPEQALALKDRYDAWQKEWPRLAKENVGNKQFISDLLKKAAVRQFDREAYLSAVGKLGKIGVK